MHYYYIRKKKLYFLRKNSIYTLMLLILSAICVLHHEGIYSICLVPSATGMRPFQRTAPNSFKVATSFAVLTDCTGQCSAMLCAAATPAACPVPMQLAMTRSEANA